MSLLLCNLIGNLMGISLGFAHASTVLVQAPKAHVTEYRATLRAHADYTSPVTQYLNAHPTASHREQLLSAFTEAQRVFVQASNGEAQPKLMGVLSLLFEDDWNRNDRGVFLLTYFRLAQLEIDGIARDRWLAQSLLLGTDLDVDESLVPPPLVARRLELARELPLAVSNRANPATGRVGSNFSAGWDEILVNGQRCPSGDCSRWTRFPGRVRVTFLSNQWLPQTETVETSDLANLQPQTVSWVEGKCGSPHWNPQSHDFLDSKDFWSLQCDKPEPVAMNLKPVAAAALEHPTVVPTLNLKNTSTPFYQSKWLWIGAGVVTAIVIVAHNAKSRDHRETTTSYGY